ncbi:hypothetical protein MNBD_ALPHA11-417 [hydrothermal vent metagenome]|uniref:DUF4142 domain-containing protein n=1 Tax=hydrothermal vent metagenome TaxID=652676 RepID=A0A3B0TZJ4_9ZZZZ
MKLIKPLMAIGFAIALNQSVAMAQSPADLNDLEIAHVAYTADNIDIRYAHLALALSNNKAVHEFASTMIRDHEAVNELALALLAKLDAQPQDNFLSMTLQRNSEDLIDNMRKLSGAEFDIFYAKNEVAYHKAVIDLVANAFIPNIENDEVKSLFEEALAIFEAHKIHAENMLNEVM